MDGLAFLPLDDVAAGMAYLRGCVPTGSGLEAVSDLLDYFDTTYVTGAVRRIQRPAQNDRIQTIRIRRIPPLFPPAVWNVHEATLCGSPRTNNFCESWNHTFSKLVGHAHPSLYVLISSLQEDESMASTAILQAARGQPPKKRVRRTTTQLQARLLQICEERRDGVKTVEETLCGVGHNIRL